MGFRQIEGKRDFVADGNLIAGRNLRDEILFLELGVDIVFVSDKLRKSDVERKARTEGILARGNVGLIDALGANAEDDSVALLSTDGIIEFLAIDVLDETGHDVLVEVWRSAAVSVTKPDSIRGLISMAIKAREASKGRP